ncbi:MAG: CRISPR-associated endoribonuclease Cas6 [Candidatus Omnitrophica bacterium]|nr:CRISPR-associated endoribonuclease Cas6 [Candidatus Omnitrophota bacterium]
MRFYLIFKGSSIKVEKGKDIRRHFISFLKKIFSAASKSKYEELFSTKKTKPYVYSPFLGLEWDKEILGPHISIIFSSGNISVISHFWNGILALKKIDNLYIEIEKEKFILDNIKILPQRRIISSKIICKSIGAIIMTDPSTSPSNFSKWFLIPSKENLPIFNDVLNKRLELSYKSITGKDLKNKEVVFDLLPEHKITELIVPVFNGYVKCFKGIFSLEGAPEVLQFLYDFGMGVRTGQGFGMFELIKQL